MIPLSLLYMYCIYDGDKDDDDVEDDSDNFYIVVVIVVADVPVLLQLLYYCLNRFFVNVCK